MNRYNVLGLNINSFYADFIIVIITAILQIRNMCSRELNGLCEVAELISTKLGFINRYLTPETVLFTTMLFCLLMFWASWAPGPWLQGPWNLVGRRHTQFQYKVVYAPLKYKNRVKSKVLQFMCLIKIYLTFFDGQTWNVGMKGRK